MKRSSRQRKLTPSNPPLKIKPNFHEPHTEKKQLRREISKYPLTTHPTTPKLERKKEGRKEGNENHSLANTTIGNTSYGVDSAGQPTESQQIPTLTAEDYRRQREQQSPGNAIKQTLTGVKDGIKGLFGKGEGKK
ncbi:hypothetical protein ACMFMG_003910 [Clarireedia jacksonii]